MVFLASGNSHQYDFVDESVIRQAQVPGLAASEVVQIREIHFIDHYVPITVLVAQSISPNHVKLFCKQWALTPPEYYRLIDKRD